MPEGLSYPLTTQVELDNFELWYINTENTVSKNNLVRNLCNLQQYTLKCIAYVIIQLYLLLYQQICIFGALGGINIRKIIWNILSYLITNQLAKEFNWPGTGLKKKQPFYCLQIKYLIICKYI